MKKLLLAAIAATAFSSAFAANENYSNLVFKGTAIKNVEPQLEVSAGDRAVEFLFIHDKNKFETVTKPITVSVKGAGDTLKQPGFQITSSLKKNTLYGQADASTIKAQVQIGNVILNDKDQVLFDKDKNVLGTFATSPNNAGRVSAQSAAIMNLVSITKIDGTPGEISDLKLGSWVGDIELQFTSSWN